MAMFEDMRQSRRTWTRTIEKAKTSHWKQFLKKQANMAMVRESARPTSAQLSCHLRRRRFTSFS
jgi:hypothetical protein